MTKALKKRSEAEADPKTEGGALVSRPVAVIDVGTTAIRMQLAEILENGDTRPLDALQQAVPLGKDRFTRGRLQQSTIQQCVDILRGYHRVMQEYGITRPGQILAVATSAVREALNRDTLLDRIYTATGIDVRVIDEAEENRLTYLAFQSLAAGQPELKSGDVLVVEIGGGSTEVVFVQQGRVTFADMYRLGALRMRESLETYRAPSARVRSMLTQHIERTVEQIRRSLPPMQGLRLMAMSGDARFAAAQLGADWKHAPLVRLDLKPFAALVDKVLPLSTDRLVRRYQLPYQDAETAGPALLAYLLLARAFKVEQLLVPRTSLRDGLLRDMTVRDLWSGAFAGEVLDAARALAQKYHVDEAHAGHVMALGTRLFAELQPEHRMGPRHLILLQTAALLHEIGSFVSNRSHHKHSQYLIAHSDLFGLTHEDIAVVALVARYHRRAVPNPLTHPDYAALDRDNRIAVSKMAALLRVADALDRNHLQQVRDIACTRDQGQFVISVAGVEDLTIERLAVRDKGNLFEEMYGMIVNLREARAESAG